MKSTYFCLFTLLILLGIFLNYTLYLNFSRNDLIGFNLCYVVICFLIYFSFQTGSQRLAESYAEYNKSIKNLAAAYSLDEGATQILSELVRANCSQAVIYKFISDCLLNGRSKAIIKPDSNYPLYIHKYKEYD